LRVDRYEKISLDNSLGEKEQWSSLSGREREQANGFASPLPLARRERAKSRGRRESREQRHADLLVSTAPELYLACKLRGAALDIEFYTPILIVDAPILIVDAPILIVDALLLEKEARCDASLVGSHAAQNVGLRRAMKEEEEEAIRLSLWLSFSLLHTQISNILSLSFSGRL